MTSLFSIRLDFDHESFTVDYESPHDALHDQGLARGMASGAVASIWSGGLRITRDLAGWDALRSQLVNNATTLLRRGIE